MRPNPSDPFGQIVGRRSSRIALFAGLLAAYGCSGSDGGDSTETGGTGGGMAASGGSAAQTGGASSTGGLNSTSAGGSPEAGGATAASGGSQATGGTFVNGGASAAGGSVTAGTTGSGGTSTAGGSSAAGGSTVVLTPNITIDTATKYQTIDGFGAALPMWGGSTNMWTTAEVQKAVGMGDSEIGMSILRTIIDPDKNRWSYAVANLKEAKSYGSEVKALATPWSPPASMKGNNSTTCAGIKSSTDPTCRLKTDSYAAYATHLNDYVTYMSGQGVAIDVVSIQNEPDYPTDYESCLWNGTEFLNFVKNNASAIKGTKLMIPESLQFTRSFSDPTLNDATAVNNISYIGGHLYGAEASGKLSEYPLANQKGKPQWMTEWNFHEADGSGAAIWGGDNQTVWNESLDVVMRSVHMSMAAKWSAYIWWWGRRYYSFIGDGESAYGTTKSAVLKRGWAFSHYAKFVRPGYSMVKATANTTYANVQLTAYDGDKNVVVVLLNRATSAYKDVIFKIPNGVTSAKAYVTSQTTNRSALAITPAGTYATLSSLPARSIVTVVMSY
jgi:O-glycosyl hydrolase